MKLLSFIFGIFSIISGVANLCGFEVLPSWAAGMYAIAFGVILVLLD